MRADANTGPAAYGVAGSHTARLAAGDLVVRAGQLALLAGLALAIVLAWRDPAANARYSVGQAADLLNEGRYSAAVALLESALPAYDAASTRLYLSYGYLARHDAVRAERQARLAIASAPPGLLPAAWTQLGRVLSFAGQQDGAIEAWQTAIRLPGSAGSARRSAAWHLAMALWARSAQPSARALLNSLLDQESIYAESARLKLAQLSAPDDPAGALRLLGGMGAPGAEGRAIADLRVPGLAEGLSAGTISRAADQLRLAIGQAADAKASGASDGVLAVLWGSAFLQQGESTLARLYLERAVKLVPRQADAHARLGLALLDEGDIDGARVQLEQAVTLDPSLPIARHALAGIYTSRKEWGLALQQLKALDKLEPESVEVHIEYAEMYRQQGDYQAAEKEYVAAAELQRTGLARPTTIDAFLALARFYTDVRGQGCEKGLAPAQDSLARSPSDPASLDAVGWAFVLCGRLDEATPTLGQAVSASPDTPRYRYHLAKAYAMAGRSAAAREQFSQVLDLDPGGPWERLAQKELAASGNR